jgi:hypothetical protein
MVDALADSPARPGSQQEVIAIEDVLPLHGLHIGDAVGGDHEEGAQSRRAFSRTPCSTARRCSRLSFFEIA